MQARASTDVDSRIEPILEALATAKSVAILRLGSIGDVIQTVPFAWMLKERLPPGARIVWLVHPESARLLQAVPALDDVVAVPRATALHALRAWRDVLAGRSFDLLFDLHGNLKSGAVALLSRT